MQSMGAGYQLHSSIPCQPLCRLETLVPILLVHRSNSDLAQYPHPNQVNLPLTVRFLTWPEDQADHQASVHEPDRHQLPQTLRVAALLLPCAMTTERAPARG